MGNSNRMGVMNLQGVQKSCCLLGLHLANLGICHQAYQQAGVAVITCCFLGSTPQVHPAAGKLAEQLRIAEEQR